MDLPSQGLFTFRTPNANFYVAHPLGWMGGGQFKGSVHAGT